MAYSLLAYLYPRIKGSQEDVATFSLGDLKQLNGFCKKIESESFIPFRPEEFGAQTARDIDRYYQVVDETYKLFLTHKELTPQTKGLRKAPRWQGFSQYLRVNGLGISIDHIRTLWKSPATIETPFWFHIWDTKSQNGDISEKLARYHSSIDAKKRDDFMGPRTLPLFQNRILHWKKWQKILQIKSFSS